MTMMSNPTADTGDDLNSGFVTEFTAWAATAVSMPEATPGIDITQAQVDGSYREEVGSVVHWGSDNTLWGQSPYDDTRLDGGVADSQLTILGWERTSDWTDSSGQWAATVIPITASSIIVQHATMVLHTELFTNGLFPVKIEAADGGSVDEFPAGMWNADGGNIQDITGAAEAAGWSVGKAVWGYDVRFPMSRTTQAVSASQHDVDRAEMDHKFLVRDETNARLAHERATRKAEQSGYALAVVRARVALA